VDKIGAVSSCILVRENIYDFGVRTITGQVVYKLAQGIARANHRANN
jgi:hypothetical protein